jgi:hypothetical protein
MCWRSTTETLIVVNVVAVALYDVAARVFGGNESTVSYALLDASVKWPVVPLAVGVLIGHVFWGVR